MWLPAAYLLGTDLYDVHQSHVKIGSHPLHTVPGGTKVISAVIKMFSSVVQKNTGCDVNCVSTMFSKLFSSVVQNNTGQDVKCCNMKNKKLIIIWFLYSLHCLSFQTKHNIRCFCTPSTFSHSKYNITLGVYVLVQHLVFQTKRSVTCFRTLFNVQYSEETTISR
jgi:hypothetical protein